MQRRIALVALFALVAAGCASMRSVDVGSGSNSSVAVNVYNARSSSVSVSYMDGDTSRDLGEVRAGQTERFVVVSQNTSVSLYARTSSGARLGPYTVSLTGGGTQTVTVR